MIYELCFVLGSICGIADVAGYGPIGWWFNHKGKQMGSDALALVPIMGVAFLIVPPIYGYGFMKVISHIV